MARHLLGLFVICALLTGGAAFGEEGVYVLDGRGGLYSAGTVSGMPEGPYFEWNIARDLVLAPNGEGYYVLTGDGQIFEVGQVPDLDGQFFGWDIVRQLILAPQGHYVLDGFGILHAFDGAPKLESTVLPEPVAQAFALAPDGRGGYILDRFGGIHPVGDVEPVVGPYFGWDIARDLVLNEDGSFYVLDGYGGIHCEGSVFLNGPYFTFDTAKRLAVLPTGDGAMVLDGQGGIHPVGNAPAIMADFSLRGNSAVDIELSSSGIQLGAIQGQVETDAPAPGGQMAPMPPAILQGLIARLEGTDFATNVAPDGFFKFNGIPEGVYALLIENPANPDLKLRMARIRVRRGMTWDLGRICLRQTGRIIGTVQLEGEQMHMGTDVLLAGSSLLAKTDRDGSFRLVFVPEGDYTVVIEHPGFVPVEVTDVQVSVGSVTDLGTILLRRLDPSLLGAVEGVVLK
ncbi:MAG TPA: carboxypeptidase-like regulatory domain-containing protein, partial [bacterium]|nr:carboxypeptidase-like regulatory domain-containing protein [bacterium]